MGARRVQSYLLRRYDGSHTPEFVGSLQEYDAVFEWKKTSDALFLLENAAFLLASSSP